MAPREPRFHKIGNLVASALPATLPAMASAPSSVTLRTLGIVNSAIGVFLLIITGSQAYDQYHSINSWTPVKAEFLHADVQNLRNGSGILSRLSDNYRVMWTFRYTAQGSFIEATTSPGTGDEKQMAAWTHHFRPGEQVLIRYNPDDLGEISTAVFDWDTFSHYVWVAVWGLVILVLGLGLFRRALIMKRS